MRLQPFLDSKFVTDIGITLLHSLWQIGLVSLALVVVLRVLRKASANVRYVAAVSGMVLSLVFGVVTFVQISARSEAARYVDRVAGSRAHTAETAAMGKTLEQVGGSSSPPAVASRGVSGSDFLSNALASLPNLSPLVTFVWLLGVALLSLRLVGGLSRLRHYRNGSTDIDHAWQQVFDDLCDRVSVRGSVRIVQSAIVHTPIAIGSLRPLIIIPTSLFLQISPAELETIIAHELIHIRRYDPLVNLFQCMVETLFFYHPAIWWMSAQVRCEREFAADAGVVKLFESSCVTYARALANLEEIRQTTKQNMPRFATAANGGNLMNRIQRILNVKTETSSASSAWTAGMALLLTSVFLLATFSFNPSTLVNGQSISGQRKLAIGFVSIPPVDRTPNAPKDSDATARLLIQKLKEYKVPATGFLIGSSISDGEKLYPVRANIARLWIDAGLEIGLGGYKHIKLSNTPADEYIANIEKNERVAKQVIGNMGLPPRYFSYPFLNAGKTDEDRAKVESWLFSRGYTPVKYTVDNQEWMYSYAYDMARNDNDINTMSEIRQAYLAYMSKMFDHYEAYSQEMFGRDIPQTMVLTPSRLITDTADEFFGMVGRRGYKFISIDEAQSDPAYKTKEDFKGDAGISWFERWRMAKGQKLLVEPDPDAFVSRTWAERDKQSKK